MKAVVVFLSGLHALAILTVLSAAPLAAQAVDPTAETVPNPFQGTAVADDQTAKPTPSKSKLSKAAKTEPAVSDAEAKKRCGTDLVVWANKKSKVYHYASSSHYGRTKNSVYMCEKESMSAGMRAAKNEKRS